MNEIDVGDSNKPTAKLIIIVLFNYLSRNVKNSFENIRFGNWGVLHFNIIQTF